MNTNFTYPNEGGKQKYEKYLVEERNRKFFENLKHTPGIYNVQQWENDYKHQVSK